MSYTVLARRYRSRDFDELVGQEPVARTLRNAIDAGRTAHAYLFCGTRGVGKTSMARIFARALNVGDALTEGEQIAEAIFRGDDLDVIEIDGASNRGIQEAKDLIAGAGLSPTRCPYKIYIIDEVHMLTREAFNSLLKTMEEPPAHVKFILCTTEPQKVPATIQSRCQRFDFRAITAAAITTHLKHLLTQEGIEVDEAVVHEVARLGNGSMRDALSLLDRLTASGEKSLTQDTARQLLGLPDLTLVNHVVDAIIAADPASGLTSAHELLARGTGVDQSLELIAEHVRLLMIIKACGSESDLLDVAPDAAQQAAAQAEHFDLPSLVHMIAVCDAAARNAKGSAISRALFEAAIVRLCLANDFAPISDVLAGAETKKKSRSVAAEPTPSATPVRAAPSAAAAPSETPAPPKPAGPAPTTAEEIWARVLDQANASDADHARVEHLTPRLLEGKLLHLSITGAGVDRAGFLAAQTGSIEQIIERATGHRFSVRIDDPPRREQPKRATPQEQANKARSMPIVQKALDLFDAVIVDVQDAPAPPPNAPSKEEME